MSRVKKPRLAGRVEEAARSLTSKIYKGKRIGGEAIVTVEKDGRDVPLKHVVRHSPTGFSWGFGGSGPADLSLSILTDFLGVEPTRTLYMTFKQRVVACLLLDVGWVMTGEDILKALPESADHMRKYLFGSRNVEVPADDVFYCGYCGSKSRKIRDEEHAIGLGLFTAYMDRGYADFVIIDGKPKACIPLPLDNAHKGHLWQYGRAGHIICECGANLGKY